MDPNRLLSAVRVTKLMSALQDKRGIDAKLVNLARTPVVPATDGEIMARFSGQVIIADLIADGQRAGLYSPGKISLESTTIPNLKLGTALTQEQLNLFLSSLNGIQVMDNLYPTTESRIVDNLRRGVQYRMEAIIIAAKMGGFSYDRLGIKMSNVDFGMPADLKITVATPWTDPVNATPVSDVSVATRVGEIKYGILYDRMKIDLSAFNYAIATAEFQAKARQFMAPNVSFVNLDLSNREAMRNLAQNVFGKEIEITGQRYWTEKEDGTLGSAPFQPINKVILESSQSDGDASVIDFANGVVTEALISNMPDSPIQGQLPLNARGPVGYVTSEHNPPSASYWGVGRGFARRHVMQATACLTIAPDSGGGSITETIDFNEIPFA